VRTNRYTQIDANECFTPTTLVSVSNETLPNHMKEITETPELLGWINIYAVFAVTHNARNSISNWISLLLITFVLAKLLITYEKGAFVRELLSVGAIVRGIFRTPLLNYFQWGRDNKQKSSHQESQHIIGYIKINSLYKNLSIGLRATILFWLSSNVFFKVRIR